MDPQTTAPSTTVVDRGDGKVAAERAAHWRTNLVPWLETALIVVTLLAALALLPHLADFGDASVRYRALNQLLTQHTGTDMLYSYVGPLFSLPLWVLDRKLNHGMEHYIAYYNWVLLALGVAALYLLLRNQMDRSVLRKFLLILIVASMFPNHVEWYYGEVFTAIFVGVGIVAALVLPRLGRIAGWGAAVLGVVNTPAVLIGFGFMAALRALERRRIRYVLAPVAAVAGILLESWIFRGSPFANAYNNGAGAKTIMPYSGLPEFSYPLLFGLLAVLLSFGKGLIFFVPGMLLPVKRRLNALQQEGTLNLYGLYLLWAAGVLGLILVYARWWSWDGGWFWGPRYFLLASLPASFAIAVRLNGRGLSLAGNLVTLGILTFSLWIGINGAIFDQKTLYDTCQTNNYQLGFVCDYIPEFSVLWRPFVVMGAFTKHELAYIGISLLAYLYLAAPLARYTAGQAVAAIRVASAPYLRLREWRL